MWQRGLEARILLQRQLAGANRLPQGAMQAAAAASDPQLDAAYRGLAADASALLDDMLQLLGALAEQNPAIGEAAAAAATRSRRRSSRGSGGRRRCGSGWMRRTRAWRPSGTPPSTAGTARRR